MVDLKRKKGESFESFLRKFSKRLVRSRKLKEVRSRIYFQGKRNKNAQKTRALVGMKIHSKREYLKKIGKLPEDQKIKL